MSLNRGGFSRAMLIACAWVTATNLVAQPAKPAARPVKFAYRFNTGDARNYRILGYFHGIFPPFSQAEKPINLKLQFTYEMRVGKVTPAGAQVTFTATDPDISILLKEPGPDGKVDPDDEAPLPLPLEQVQKALNVETVLKPDGTIVEVKGGNPDATKIDIGIELRKLFLLTMPTTFPTTFLKVGSTWKFDDGVIGKKEGKTSYSSMVKAISGPKPILELEMNATSLVEDNRDKAGKPSTDLKMIVDSTNGKVTVKGQMSYPSSGAGMSHGKLTLIAKINHSRTIPDPDKPDDPLVNNIDITANLTVHEVPVKPEVKPLTKGTKS